MQTIKTKVGAAALGGAASTAAWEIAEQATTFSPSGALVASTTTLAAFGLAWFVPDELWRKSATLLDDVDVDGIPSNAHEGS